MSAPQLELRWDRHVPAHRREAVAQLIPLAQDLARRAGETGITVADLRLYAVQQGILTGTETGRQLSYLGAVMRAAGLTATDRVRRSMIERSHGNLQRVWCLPTGPEHVGAIAMRVLADIAEGR
jgi:hypothetical protein